MDRQHIHMFIELCLLLICCVLMLFVLKSVETKRGDINCYHRCLKETMHLQKLNLNNQTLYEVNNTKYIYLLLY